MGAIAAAALSNNFCVAAGSVLYAADSAATAAETSPWAIATSPSGTESYDDGVCQSRWCRSCAWKQGFAARAPSVFNEA